MGSRIQIDMVKSNPGYWRSVDLSRAKNLSTDLPFKSTLPIFHVRGALMIWKLQWAIYKWDVMYAILLYLTYYYILSLGQERFLLCRRHTKRPVKCGLNSSGVLVHNHIPFNRFYDWRCNKCLWKMYVDDAFFTLKKCTAFCTYARQKHLKLQDLCAW